MVGLDNLYLKELAEFGKETYAVQFSKKGASELLSCLYLNAGENLKRYLDEPTEKGMAAEFASIKPIANSDKKPKVEVVEEVKPAPKKAEPKQSAATKAPDMAA